MIYHIMPTLVRQLEADKFACVPHKGPRWQAPSCKCYDTPSEAAMESAPPALDIDASGQWVVRDSGVPASIQVRSGARTLPACLLLAYAT
jgi:hypothetical protein